MSRGSRQVGARPRAAHPQASSRPSCPPAGRASRSSWPGRTCSTSWTPSRAPPSPACPSGGPTRPRALSPSLPTAASSPSPARTRRCARAPRGAAGTGARWSPGPGATPGPPSSASTRTWSTGARGRTRRSPPTALWWSRRRTRRTGTRCTSGPGPTGTSWPCSRAPSSARRPASSCGTLCASSCALWLFRVRCTYGRNATRSTTGGRSRRTSRSSRRTRSTWKWRASSTSTTRRPAPTPGRARRGPPRPRRWWTRGHCPRPRPTGPRPRAAGMTRPWTPARASSGSPRPRSRTSTPSGTQKAPPSRWPMWPAPR
mmetsp:Transcript_9171/g.31050  ORF Transcript_9171/g.31050 Transcript_9171/m.31050 type:complete len:315 (+) Transcript_9171:546-1490(+)